LSRNQWPDWPEYTSDLRESMWRSYNKVLMLGRDNAIRTIDFGLVTSSAAETICRFVINHLRQIDEIAKDISPRSLQKNWPPAFIEWSTKSVRDAFYASPQFPRLLSSEAIKDAVARGVAEGHFAYVGRSSKGGYSPFYFKKSIAAGDVEISDDMYLIQAEEAVKYIKPAELTKILISPPQIYIQPGKKQAFMGRGFDQFSRDFELGKIEWSATGGEISKSGVFQAGQDEGNFIIIAKSNKTSGEAAITIAKEDKPKTPLFPGSKSTGLAWTGEVPPQKWMNFYTKVLSRFVKGGTLKIDVSFEASPEGGLSEQQIEETKASLRELGLDDEINKGQ